MINTEKKSSLDKRIKRQLIGKPHRFLAITPLGFEQTLVNELKYFGIAADVTEDKTPHIIADGKVGFIAKITEAWKAVAYTRIANRILMEIGSFKAENFRQLEKHASEIPWSLYLCSQNIQFHTTCKHSRLYHSNAIEERVKKIIEENLTTNISFETIPSTHSTQNCEHIYIKFLDDYCSIWIDLAGEELYKRGHERYVAEAPLKETIAAAMIFEAFNLQSLNTNNQVITIVDPMAGSGTFSLEVSYIANGLIPGKCRDFALKHHPAFKEAAWKYIINTHNKSNLDTIHSSKICHSINIITSDISDRPLNIIKHNIESSPLINIYNSCNDKTLSKIIPQKKDFFSYTIKDFINISKTQNNSLIKTNCIAIMLNPPYGKRLNFDAPKLYIQIGEKINEWVLDVQRLKINLIIAILAPKDDIRNHIKYTCTSNLQKACPALNPHHNTLVKIIETSHGGISLNAIFAKV